MSKGNATDEAWKTIVTILFEQEECSTFLKELNRVQELVDHTRWNHLMTEASLHLSGNN